jgi:hypothetical protein
VLKYMSRRPHERPSGAVLSIPRLLPDYHDLGICRALAKNDASCVLKECAAHAPRCFFREPSQGVFETPVSCGLFVRGSFSSLIHVASPAQGPLDLPGRAQALVLHRAGRIHWVM